MIFSWQQIFIWWFALFCSGLVVWYLQRRKKARWQAFKKEYKCKLIEVDETGFLGTTKYKWRLKDGTTIINNYPE